MLQQSQGRRRSLGPALLRTCRQQQLQPYGFTGTEEHFVPLDPTFIQAVDFSQQTLFVQLPQGVIQVTSYDNCMHPSNVQWHALDPTRRLGMTPYQVRHWY